MTSPMSPSSFGPSFPPLSKDERELGDPSALTFPGTANQIG